MAVDFCVNLFIGGYQELLDRFQDAASRPDPEAPGGVRAFSLDTIAPREVQLGRIEDELVDIPWNEPEHVIVDR